MIEYKVVSLEGRNLEDYTASINNYANKGWKVIGTVGKNNMLLVICRDIKIEEQKIDD